MEGPTIEHEVTSEGAHMINVEGEYGVFVLKVTSAEAIELAEFLMGCCEDRKGVVHRFEICQTGRERTPEGEPSDDDRDDDRDDVRDDDEWTSGDHEWDGNGLQAAVQNGHDSENDDEEWDDEDGEWDDVPAEFVVIKKRPTDSPETHSKRARTADRGDGSDDGSDDGLDDDLDDSPF